MLYDQRNDFKAIPKDWKDFYWSPCGKFTLRTFSWMKQKFFVVWYILSTPRRRRAQINIKDVYLLNDPLPRKEKKVVYFVLSDCCENKTNDFWKRLCQFDFKCYEGWNLRESHWKFCLRLRGPVLRALTLFQTQRIKLAVRLSRPEWKRLCPFVVSRQTYFKMVKSYSLFQTKRS